MKTLSFDQFKKRHAINNRHKQISEILDYLYSQTGVAIVFSTCCECGRDLGVKAGDGTHGVSDTYCPECHQAEKQALEYLRTSNE